MGVREHRPGEYRQVLLGVSGGIAAYKACEVVRRLRGAGAEVRVVLTENAERFVTALTFQALSCQPVRRGLWDAEAEMGMGHLELARWADAILIAPASADARVRPAAADAGERKRPPRTRKKRQRDAERFGQPELARREKKARGCRSPPGKRR